MTTPNLRAAAVEAAAKALQCELESSLGAPATPWDHDDARRVLTALSQSTEFREALQGVVENAVRSWQYECGEVEAFLTAAILEALGGDK